MEYYELDCLSLGDPYMKSIIRAVYQAIPNMVIGKKYTLQKMVELGSKGVWNPNRKQINKMAGRTFKELVLDDIPNLVLASDYGKYPIKYEKIR